MKKIISLFFVLISLTMSSIKARELYTENLVIVMDCSGSMTGYKIEQAKKALKEVLKYIPSNIYIGLLSFGENSGWKYPLGPRDNEKLILAIDDLYTGGATPLGQYMKYGADRLLQEKGKQMGYGNYRLLVITDGEAQNKDLVDSYTPEIMARGITVDVIGVFMKEEHSLSKMAHSYRKADDTPSLKRAISEVLAEIGGQKDDTVTTEAFDTISGLPDEIVSQLIIVLSNPPDYPIGEKPQKETIEQKHISPPQAVEDKKEPPQKSSKGYIDFLVIIFIVIFIIIVRLSKRSKRRRKR